MILQNLNLMMSRVGSNGNDFVLMAISRGVDAILGDYDFYTSLDRRFSKEIGRLIFVFFLGAKK